MKKTLFNYGWEFFKDGSSDVLLVDLPHDAMIAEKRDPECANSYNTGFYPGGCYHYRKHLQVPAEMQGRQIRLLFEGVYRNSTVFVNGQEAGGHRYGYSEFQVDLAPYLNYGGDNEIEVVAHNEETPNSRWYSGSGIFRNVYLLESAPTHIEYLGTRVKTLSIEGDTATIQVSIRIANPTDTMQVVSKIYFDNTCLLEGIGANFTAQIPHANLWSAEHPHLHKIRVRILENGNIVDEDTEIFGIRTVECSVEKGMLINGQRVFLNGACIHNDNGLLGSASWDEAEERRVSILKQAGFNAIRSAHNPISKGFMEACDRLGMYIMDEAFDMWFSRKTEFDYASDFRANWRYELEHMVMRDYNHPSVVMYSIGNEIRDILSPRAIEMSKLMQDAIHAIDDSRYTILCSNLITAMTGQSTDAPMDVVDPIEFVPGANTILEAPSGNDFLVRCDKIFNALVHTNVVEKKLKGIFDSVDITGYNYCIQGPVADLKKKRNRIGCASETYPHEISKNYKVYQTCSNMVGDFVWTGWDYIGEACIGIWDYGDLTPGLYKPYPSRLAGCGLVDITGHITEQAYYRRLVTGQEKNPLITVRPLEVSHLKYRRSIWRQFDGLSSWSWEGFEGKKAIIQVYSLGKKVALYLNGEKIGMAPVKDFYAEFKLPYQPGTLEAISYDAEGKQIGRHVLTSASAQDQVQLLPENRDGKLLYLNMKVTDEKGILKMTRDKKLSVCVEGDGTLMGLGNANPMTAESFGDTSCTTWFGRASAVVKKTKETGRMKVIVTPEGMDPVVYTCAY